MSPELEELRDQLKAVILDSFGRLHAQIQETERRLSAQMQQGFERLDARLGRRCEGDHTAD
jgi:hypothetical protein